MLCKQLSSDVGECFADGDATGASCRCVGCEHRAEDDESEPDEEMDGQAT